MWWVLPWLLFFAGLAGIVTSYLVWQRHRAVNVTVMTDAQSSTAGTRD